MNWVDAAIGIFSPAAEYKRTAYRRANSILRKDGKRRFEGASNSRRTDGWKVSGSSINLETRTYLAILRNRSRDLVQNTAYGRRFIQAVRNNSIGTGIKLTPSGKNKKTIETMKELWWKWAETKQCDWNNRETFYGLQKLIIGTVAQDGECIVRKRRIKSANSIPIQLQVCEADFLDDTKQADKVDGGGYIEQGVEFNKDGKVVAYHLWDRHPSERISVKSERVDADDVLHIFLQDRAGQVRGIPWAHAIMIKMRDFDDYEDAELVRQKIAACFSVFIEKDQDVSSMSTSEKEEADRVEPGIIEHLNPGEKVSFASPPTTQNYDAYSRKQLQAIAAGIGMSYESLTGDLSNVNFSSGRMGWLEFHRNVYEWQTRIIITQLCEPVFEWFKQGLKVASRNLPDMDNIYAEWTTPRREMIDPVKETRALSDQVQNLFIPWQEAVRSIGMDPDVVISQAAEDIKRFDSNKLVSASDARFTGKQKAQPNE